MKTPHTIVFFTMLFALSSLSATAQSSNRQGGLESLGAQWAKEERSPLLVLKEVARYRSRGDYIHESTPAKDMAGQIWQGYRTALTARAGVISFFVHPVLPQGMFTKEDFIASPEYSALAGADLRGLNLQEFNWQGLDLRNTRFDHCFVDGKFVDCLLSGSTWEQASMEFVLFRNCEMENVVFNWREFMDTGVTFVNSSLRGSDLTQMFSENDNTAIITMRSCDLNGANIPAMIYAQASVRDCTGMDIRTYYDGVNQGMSNVMSLNANR